MGIKKTGNSIQPVLIGIVTFTVAAILTHVLAYQRYLINKEAEQYEMLREADGVKDRLKSTLSHAFSATKTLAFLVERYGPPENFDSLAKHILDNNKYIDAIELTKGGVITHIYPMKGNEKALGYDILRDSMRKQEALQVLERKELFFAGPLELKQGGTAVIARFPIFRENKFWGFAMSVVRLPALFKAAGMDSLRNGKYAYQLSKINPATGIEEFFMPPGSAPDGAEMRQFTIKVPDGEWNLTIMAREKHSFFNIIFIGMFGLLFSVTLGVFAWHLVKQPQRLNMLVEEKTLQLRASEKYFRSLIEKCSDGIVLLDAKGNVLYLSQAAERITGYSLGEMQAFGSFELVHPDDRERNRQVFSELLRTPGLGVKSNQRFRHKQGHYIWLEGHYSNLLDDKNINAVVYNYHEVTERVEAEQKALASELEKERIRRLAEGRIMAEKVFSDSIINSLPGVLYIYDITGKFIRWNRNFETVSGYSAEEIRNMRPVDFFHEDEKALLLQKIDQVFSLGKAEVQAHFYTKGRELIPYYFNGRKVNFEGKDYLMGMGIDITDRVAAETELLERTREIKRLTSHMEQIQEEERTRIAREIHDELGQQLTGLKIDAYWIKKRLGSQEAHVHEKISDMISLIDETIKTIRRISSELRPGILDDLGLMAAIEWQGQEFEKRTGVKSRFTTNMSDFNPERHLSTQIFRVYQEALTNIARHAGATSVDTLLEEKDGYVTLRIQDNGVGFDTSIHSLGLIGMKERAMSCQGELSITSEKGKGTTISLKVPLMTKTI